MGSILDTITGGASTRSLGDYISVDFNDEGIDSNAAEDATGLQIHVAKISNNQDLLDAKDVLYAGGILIATIAPCDGITEERIIDKLVTVSEDVQGDIIQKSNGELVISPAGISISRDRIGR